MKTFPVLMDHESRQKYPAAPSEIPWDFIEMFRERAEKNHNQTLERLAERGGLSPIEIFAAVHNLGLFHSNLMNLADSIKWLTNALEWHN